MEILNLNINPSLNNNSLYDSNNLFFKLSIAESHLKEYYKEESLIKAVNIIKEILSSEEIEKNLKNILNILLSKIMECYTKCDNKTRFVINHIINTNKKKFSNIFINKEVINYLIAVVTCSDSIARGYSLQLISYLPTLIEKRLDVLHTTFDLFISEKVPSEEKLIIINLYKEILLRNSVSRDTLINLLFENFELIMKAQHCKVTIFDSDDYCEKCFCLKQNTLSLLKLIISEFKCFRVNDLNKISQSYSNYKPVDIMKKYLITHGRYENFKINSYLLLLIKFSIDAAEFHKFIVETIKSNPNPNVLLAIIHIFNFFDFQKENQRNTSLIDILTRFNVNDLFSKIRKYSLKHRTFFLGYYLYHLLKNEETSMKDHYENFEISKLNFTEFIKVLYMIAFISKESTDNYIDNHIYKINEKNLKIFIDKNSDLTMLNMKINRNTFNNHRILNEIIHVLKSSQIFSEDLHRDIVNIITNHILKIVSFFKTKDDYQYYFYFLCLCVSNGIDHCSFVKMLMVQTEISSQEITNYLIKGLIKFELRYLKSPHSKLIEKFTTKQDFSIIYYSFKEYFIANQLNECDELLKKSRNIELKNSEIFLNFLNKAIRLKRMINENILENSKTSLEIIKLLFTELDNFGVERKILCFKNLFSRKDNLVTNFSSDFFSYPMEILKILISYFDKDNSESSKDLHTMLNSPMVVWFLKDQKLSELIDLRLNGIQSNPFVDDILKSLISHFSKYLVVMKIPLDIKVSNEISRDKSEKFFKINMKIKLKNFSEYFEHQVFCEVLVNDKIIRKENFNKEKYFKEFNLVYENSSNLEKDLCKDKQVDKYKDKDEDMEILSSTLKPKLKTKFYVIYENFYRFDFYECSV